MKDEVVSISGQGDEPKGSAPYQPDTFPPYSVDVRLNEGITDVLLRVPEAAEEAAKEREARYETPYNYIDGLHEATRSPEGYKPTAQDALEYAAGVTAAIFPDRDRFGPNEPVGSYLAVINTRSLTSALEEVRRGQDPFAAMVEAELSTTRLRQSFEALLGTRVYDYLILANYNKEYADAESEPEKLRGDDLEFSFLMKVENSKHLPGGLDSRDKELMVALGHYRAAVLAEEVIIAAKQEREVNRELVERLWRVNNVREATILSLNRNQKPESAPE